ncbi:hypothetical protein K3N28_07530 [Glycomyces sp. TRM65418]|uniref:hypothetical protein n=1 Tax=Glycomyces sp. TRM65418 TaxID=2867006 RepID=UPI001CE5C02B|nr:hypothetical protein [Glycomyces sp. TRM65418]MCC3762921.1 hypothetical protein [Glycomyces sp. TRM65418]QZD56946.1 hypothetical protein K3N28_07480 [Glycomyces sp. TRM65418]
MSSGKLRTFALGKAKSLPRQGAAPQTEAWQVDEPQAKASPKRFSPASLIGRVKSDGNAGPGAAAGANGSAGQAAAASYGAGRNGGSTLHAVSPDLDGASLSSVVDTAAANSSASTAPEPPGVRLRRLAGVATWALALVLAGVVSAIVGLFRIFGDSPGWFTPAFISCGVVGMMLAMMAFATVRFRGVPWMFMAASSVTLLAAFLMLRLA